MQTDANKKLSLDWTLLAKDERRSSDWWIGDTFAEAAAPPLSIPSPQPLVQKSCRLA